MRKVEFSRSQHTHTQQLWRAFNGMKLDATNRSIGLHSSASTIGQSRRMSPKRTKISRCKTSRRLHIGNFGRVTSETRRRTPKCSLNGNTKSNSWLKLGRVDERRRKLAVWLWRMKDNSWARHADVCRATLTQTHIELFFMESTFFLDTQIYLQATGSALFLSAPSGPILTSTFSPLLIASADQHGARFNLSRMNYKGARVCAHRYRTGSEKRICRATFCCSNLLFGKNRSAK